MYGLMASKSFLLQGVIFDAGGVLVEPGKRIARQAWANRLSTGVEEFTALVWAAMGSRGVRDKEEIIERLSKATGLPLSDAHTLLADFHKHWRINEHLLSFLRDLRPRYRTAVLANAGPAARFGFEELLSLHTAVDFLGISAEIGKSKPDPAAYRFVLEKLGLPAEAVLFIDDRVENVAAAQALGLQGIHHKDTTATLSALRIVLAQD